MRVLNDTRSVEEKGGILMVNLKISNKKFLEYALGLTESNPYEVMVSDSIVKRIVAGLTKKVSVEKENAIFSVKVFTRAEAKNTKNDESGVFEDNSTLYLDNIGDIVDVFTVLKTLKVKEIAYFMMFGYVFIIAETKEEEESVNSYIVIRLAFLDNPDSKTERAPVENYMNRFEDTAVRYLGGENVIRLGQENAVVKNLMELKSLYNTDTLEKTETGVYASKMDAKKFSDDEDVFDSEEEKKNTEQILKKSREDLEKIESEKSTVFTDYEKTFNDVDKFSKEIFTKYHALNKSKHWTSPDVKSDDDGLGNLQSVRDVEVRNGKKFLEEHNGEKWKLEFANIEKLPIEKQESYVDALIRKMNNSLEKVDRRTAVAFCVDYFDFNLDTMTINGEKIPSNYKDYKEIRRDLIINVSNKLLFEVFYFIDNSNKTVKSVNGKENPFKALPNRLASEGDAEGTIWGELYEKHKQTLVESVSKESYEVVPYLLKDHLVFTDSNIETLTENADSENESKNKKLSVIKGIIGADTANAFEILSSRGSKLSDDVDSILEQWLRDDFESAVPVVLYEWNKACYAYGNNYLEHAGELVNKYMGILKPYFNKGIRNGLADGVTAENIDKIEEAVPEFKQLSDFIDLMIKGNAKNDKGESCIAFPNTKERLLHVMYRYDKM